MGNRIAFSHRRVVIPTIEAHHLDEFLINCLLEEISTSQRIGSMMSLSRFRMVSGGIGHRLPLRPLALAATKARPALSDLKNTRIIIKSRASKKQLSLAPSALQAFLLGVPALCDTVSQRLPRNGRWIRRR
jgi:hypothetical protein